MVSPNRSPLLLAARGRSDMSAAQEMAATLALASGGACAAPLLMQKGAVGLDRSRHEAWPAHRLPAKAPARQDASSPIATHKKSPQSQHLGALRTAYRVLPISPTGWRAGAAWAKQKSSPVTPPGSQEAFGASSESWQPSLLLVHGPHKLSAVKWQQTGMPGQGSRAA